MQIKVYVVTDKIKPVFRDAIKEYDKRLGRYCKIKLIHCKTEKVLQNKMNDKEYIINISHHSSSISSEALANKLNQFMLSGPSNIAFLIGANSPIARETMCISPMEMDIDLLVTIVYEQIYRSFRIIHNHPYHK